MSLFEELSTLDDVSAWIPTSKDHDAEAVPSWCELVLEIKRKNDWPVNTQIPLRRHDGEWVLDAIHEALHPRAGGTVAEMLWNELDDVVIRIQRRVERGKAPRNTDVGEARGLARAIAIMVNPYGYDIDSVRDEAMRRYEER